MSQSVVYTKEQNCKGCNKCIFVCPTRANEALFEQEEGKVFVKTRRCISCGECLNICDHMARDYWDGTDQLFDDISKKEPPIVIIAPASNFNFPSNEKLVGCLRSLGVEHIFDVSLGADICTWAHLKAMSEHGVSNIIAQPCPVVVNYVEKFHPELINRLSPIHSPALCLAIYLKKYLKLENKIAFLSPCIGKTQECADNNTNSAISYNLTFSKFIEALNERNINIEDSNESDFDNVPGSLGFVFSRPGGLSENIKYYSDEAIWIKQIEGIAKIRDYLKEYSQDYLNERPIPDVLDVLNCEYGCNLGTGTNKNASLNHIDYVTNERKKKLKSENTNELKQSFDNMLKYSDFLRDYEDQSKSIINVESVIDIESAFALLGKYTDEDRAINCFSCGYGSCLEFAKELAAGHNDKSNCKDYLLNKFKRLSHYDDLTGVKNRYAHTEQLRILKEQHPGFVGVMFIDINGLKEANDVHGHKHGDFLITSCVSLIKKIFPTEIYRIGGDEFFVFDSISSEYEFIEKSHELRKLFSEQRVVAVSIGSAHSYTGKDMDESIVQADKQMYENKQHYYKNIVKADRRSR